MLEGGNDMWLFKVINVQDWEITHGLAPSSVNVPTYVVVLERDIKNMSPAGVLAKALDWTVSPNFYSYDQACLFTHGANWYRAQIGEE